MAISTKCLKYLLLVFIVIYGLSGLALLVLVSFNLAQIYAFRDLLDTSVLRCNWVVWGMGAAAIATSVIGWLGTTKANRALVRGFAVLLVAIIIVQLSIAVWALVVRVSFPDDVPKSIERSFESYDKDNKACVDFWDTMQSRLQCCGVDGPSDWRGQSHIPWSCCSSDNPHEGVCQKIYQRGCIAPLVEYTALRLAQTAAFAGVATLIQGGGAFLAFFYANSIQNDKRRGNV